MTGQGGRRPAGSTERESRFGRDRGRVRRGSEGQGPGIDEIRLQAYYRYLQREDGDDDEIADWLAAESELQARGDGSPADRPRGEQP
jgi:hypothetical protein